MTPVSSSKTCGHLVLHVSQLLGLADAGDHILALGVGQVVTEDLLVAGGRVARESDAGAGVVAHVAEDHQLHVDGGAQIVGDVVMTAVGDGARVAPAAEDGL